MAAAACRRPEWSATGSRCGRRPFKDRLERCMAKFTRANAWNRNGTFDNADLLWYARGVGAMQARPLADPASWWFFAAMHGQYLQNLTIPTYFANGWGAIPSPPLVPLDAFQPP